MKFLSVTEFQRSFPKVLHELPVTITRRGVDVALISSISGPYDDKESQGEGFWAEGSGSSPDREAKT
jgi:antitoxin (DNA-binding transcriptional repressor) of toxin-antitoxin stability system